MHEPGAVLIRGDRILAAGARLHAQARRTVRPGDATTLSGIVDLHVIRVAGPRSSLGQLLYGTDVGNQGIPLGVHAEELRLLRKVGLTPEDVLAAATSCAGSELGLAPLGQLEERAPADVTAVAGDARDLRDDLAKPLLVVAGGTVAVDHTSN